MIVGNLDAVSEKIAKKFLSPNFFYGARNKIQRMLTIADEPTSCGRV